MKSTESTPEQQSTQELPENNAPQKPQQQIYETIWNANSDECRKNHNLKLLLITCMFDKHLWKHFW